MKDSILLKEAKREYPVGTLFLSASGNLKSPIRVTGLRESLNYKNVIVNVSGGILYDSVLKTWAKKV